MAAAPFLIPFAMVPVPVLLGRPPVLTRLRLSRDGGLRGKGGEKDGVYVRSEQV
jgi:hypothetical protein